MATPTVISTTRIGAITGTTGPDWPHLVDATGAPLLQDTGAWGVLGLDLGANCFHAGKTYFFFGDIVTPSEDPLEGPGPDFVAWTDDPFVARHGGHQPMGLRFILPIEPYASEGQDGWRFCTQCRSLFRESAAPDRCVGTPDGLGTHFPMGLKFRVPFAPTGIHGQHGWCFCGKCGVLFYREPDGRPGLAPAGVCPASGGHLHGDRAYVLPTIAEGESLPPEDGQPDWRYCVRCAALFWNGEPWKGTCPGAPGGGVRLHPVLNDQGRYAPFRIARPVGITQLNEVPNAAFGFEDTVYVTAGIADHPRPGDPAKGHYLCSNSDPAVPGDYKIEFLLSPKLGWCGVDLPPGAESPSLFPHDIRGFKFILPLVTPNTTSTEGGWRICATCDTLFWSAYDNDDPYGACQKGGRDNPRKGHKPRPGLKFALRRFLAEDHEYQAWCRCKKCSALFWIKRDGDPADTGRCPASGFHDAEASDYGARHVWRLEDATNQRGWRFCEKCHGLYFYAYIGRPQGVCPLGGEHRAHGLEFVLPHGVGESPTQQTDWRFCDDCFGLFYAGYPTKGYCPTNKANGHRSAGHVFSLPHTLELSGERDPGWRFCVRCFGLFRARDGNGVCPVDGQSHAPDGLAFQLPAQAGVDSDNRPFRYCMRCRCMVRHDHPIEYIKGYALDNDQANWASWIATCVVTNRRHSQALEKVPGRDTSTHGLVMIGYDGFVFRLAWMPLRPGAKPRFDTIQYYHRGNNAWTDAPDLSSGSPLFENHEILDDQGRPGWLWTHVSALYVEQARCWIVIYQKADEAHPTRHVVGRVSANLLDWSEEFSLVRPLAGAYGTYMHFPGLDETFHPHMPPQQTGFEKPGMAYGAFILERYTTWDPARRMLGLYYLLSTWSPYQVQVMYSEIEIPPFALLDRVLQFAAWMTRLVSSLGRLLGRRNG